MALAHRARHTDAGNLSDTCYDHPTTDLLSKVSQAAYPCTSGSGNRNPNPNPNPNPNRHSVSDEKYANKGKLIIDRPVA